MSSNFERVALYVAAIPLWRAFLDAKEAEQDALLAEVRNEQPPESKTQQLLGSFTQAFQRTGMDVLKGRICFVKCFTK